MNARANLAGSRLDIHKVKISMAFPKARVTQKTRKQKGDEFLKDVMGGYELNSQWRAAYALCVVTARSREEEFKNLRLDPPEVTCLESTDAFYPRGNGRDNSLLSGRRYEFPDEKSKFDEQKKSTTSKCWIRRSRTGKALGNYAALKTEVIMLVFQASNSEGGL